MGSQGAPRPAAWVHGSLGYGGGERVLVEQVRALEPRGNPIDVWTTGEPGPQDLVDAVRAANRHVRHVGRIDGTTELKREIQRRGYEALVTCWTSRAYRAVRRVDRTPRARRPVVIETVHERYGWCLGDHKGRRRDHVDFWLAMYDFRAPLRTAFDLPDERIAVTRPLFPSLLPPRAAGDPAAGAALRASLGIPEGALVIGYVGRISGNKGIHHLLPLAARLAARGIDAHLVLAGRLAPHVPAYQTRLDAIAAASAGLGSPGAGRVHLLGAVEDAHAVYAASDVVVLLSSMEGLFPLMLVEAMARGVPVVTTDVGGIGSCLTDDLDAVVVPKVPDDEEDCAPAVVSAFEDALAGLLRDPGRRARLARAGKARVESLIAENDFHGDTLAAYERALVLDRLRRE
jgi:glycosyltransferase involved in cell wall biosynthesis